MKRLFLLLFYCCLAHLAEAQIQLLPPNQPEQDACDALEICGNTFTSPYSYQGIGQISDLTNTPCFGGEGNVMWFRMNIVTGGIIVFTIAPLNQTDDYDFAVVDITGKTCSTFTQTDVIRCNFNNNWPGSNVNGIVGLNTTSTTPFTTAGATGGSFLQQINANPGDVYLIMVNNFGDPFVGGPSSGFTIDFTGTTATFNGPTPAMTSIIQSCNNATQVTLQMNHNILCNTLAANGSDFTVAGGTIASATGINCSGLSGYTDKITINFATALPPGTYNLVAQNGIDGNTLLNTCNIPLPIGSSIPFTVQPYEAPSFEEVVQPACQMFKIKLNKKVSCASIAKNASDFQVSGPQNSAVLLAYGVGCDTSNFTDTVVLVLQNPLLADGTYTISAKTGTDNNTLLDSCGIAQTVGDDISFTLNSYDGQLVAPNDTVLCDAQYVQLDVTNISIPPPQTLTCGLSTVPCTGNTAGAFIGGKDSVSTLNSPFFGAQEDTRAQYLYYASELREMGLKPGLITGIEWKVTQKLSSQPYTNFTIKIGCTPLTGMLSVFSGGTQTVFTTPSYSVVNGWNSFTFATPYNWDGTSNLLIETCFDNALSSLSDEVAHSVTPFLSVLRRSGSGLSGCTITNQGAQGAARNLRPKLRILICEPPAGVSTYRWTPASMLSDSTVKAPLAFINNDVTYHVTTVDKFGCAHRDSSVFTLSKRDPQVRPTDTTICFGQQIMLSASGGVNYSWLAADASSISCTNCPEPLVKPQQTSVYQVIVSDKYNCADTLKSTVNVNQLPVIDILEEDMVVKYGTHMQLNGSGADWYSWSPVAYLNHPNIENPIATITEPTTFYLVGIDKYGCRNIDSVTIGVDYTDPVFIPSAFTPNGDGKNDIFKVGSTSFQKLQEFRIFNRWGQEVFTTNDIEKGWDGVFNGVPQNPGVYHYIIRLGYPGGKVQMYKGDVTLIR